MGKSIRFAVLESLPREVTEHARFIAVVIDDTTYVVKDRYGNSSDVLSTRDDLPARLARVGGEVLPKNG